MMALRQLLFLLILSFLVFYGIGISDFEFSIGKYELVKADVEFPSSSSEDKIHQAQLPKPLSNTLAAKSDHTQAASSNNTIIQKKSTPKKILLIGDSMAEGLMIRLMDFVDVNHHQLKTVTWYGSNTHQYARSDTLSYFIRTYKPDLVLVALGTNEMKIPRIGKQHRKSIQTILAKLQGIPFVWIGPPSWDQDTGISDLIISEVGLAGFYPSSQLSLPRQADGIHPTRPGFATWVEALIPWMNQNQSEYLFPKTQIKPKFHSHPDLVIIRQS